MEKHEIKTLPDLVKYLDEHQINFNLNVEYPGEIPDVALDLDTHEEGFVNEEGQPIEAFIADVVAALPQEVALINRGAENFIATEVAPGIRELTPSVKGRVAPGIFDVTPEAKMEVATEIAPGIRETTPRNREVAPGIREITPIATAEVAPGIREVTPSIREVVAPGIQEITNIAATPIAAAVPRIRPCCANTRQYDIHATRCNQCGRLLH